MINSNNLAKRLLFVAWAAPLGWLFINANMSILPVSWAALFGDPGMVLYPGQVLITILIFIGLWEYTKMLGVSFPKNAFWLVFVWMAFQFLSHFWSAVSLKLRLDTYLLILLVAFEAFAYGKTSNRWKRASLLFSGTIFLSVAGFSLLAFYHEPFAKIFPGKFSNPLIAQLGIVVVMFSIVTCDTVAYFVGSTIGKHHFTSISPNKTIEGSVAGLLGAIIVSTIGWHFLADPKYPLFLGAIMGLLIGVFGQIGGFIVSLIKRYFAVKDANDIFSGHGGVLDRFDSIFFAAPILNLFFVIIIRIMG